jgi:hypothetical protein
MTTTELQTKINEQAITDIYDDVFAFFSKELPSDYYDSYDTGEIILDIIVEHEKVKELDKVIEFSKLIKEKQPELYVEHFPYIASFSIDYYCYYQKREIAEGWFSNFISDPLRDYDVYKTSFYKLLFYQSSGVLNKSVTANYKDLAHDELLIGNATYFLSQFKQYNTLEKVYNDGVKSIAENIQYHKVLDDHGFEYNKSSLNATDLGLQDEQLSNEVLLDKFLKNEADFFTTLEMYFLKYMQQRNFSFALSGWLWTVSENFWNRDLKNEESRSKPDVFFHLDKSKYEKYLKEVAGNFFFQNYSEMIALLWGSTYIYDFLKSVEIISRDTYDHYKEVTRTLKGEVIVGIPRDLWDSNFIHQWEKPDSISDTEFIEEEKIFKKSLSFIDFDYSSFKKEIADELSNLGTLSTYIDNAAQTRNNTPDFLEQRPSGTDFFSPQQVEDTTKYIQKGNTGTYKAAVKIGRNDPCPCGSGKKYKKCCIHKE